MARIRKQVAQINVVPMIDVMLVLLVIFMVTAPFINPGQVELPSVGKTAQTPSQPLEVIIKASGEYRLRNRAAGGSFPPPCPIRWERARSQAGWPAAHWR